MATGKEKFYLVGSGCTHQLTLDEIVAFAEGKIDIALPEPTENTRGGVLQVENVANIPQLTVTGTDATSVATSATTAVNLVASQVNGILFELRKAGIMPE
jgi:hypothetical protein